MKSDLVYYATKQISSSVELIVYLEMLEWYSVFGIRAYLMFKFYRTYYTPHTSNMLSIKNSIKSAAF